MLYKLTGQSSPNFNETINFNFSVSHRSLQRERCYQNTLELSSGGGTAKSNSDDRSGLAIHSFSCLKLFNGFLLPPEESQPSLMSHGPFMTCSLFLVQHHLSAPCPPFPAFYASATLLWVFQFIRFSFHELSTKVIFSGKLP